jgi:hypothetical protein
LISELKIRFLDQSQAASEWKLEGFEGGREALILVDIIVFERKRKPQQVCWIKFREWGENSVILDFFLQKYKNVNFDQNHN